MVIVVPPVVETSPALKQAKKDLSSESARYLGLSPSLYFKKYGSIKSNLAEMPTLKTKLDQACNTYQPDFCGDNINDFAVSLGRVAQQVPSSPPEHSPWNASPKTSETRAFTPSQEKRMTPRIQEMLNKGYHVRGF